MFCCCSLECLTLSCELSHKLGFGQAQKRVLFCGHGLFSYDWAAWWESGPPYAAGGDWTGPNHKKTLLWTGRKKRCGAVGLRSGGLETRLDRPLKQPAADPPAVGVLPPLRCSLVASVEPVSEEPWREEAGSFPVVTLEEEKLSSVVRCEVVTTPPSLYFWEWPLDPDGVCAVEKESVVVVVGESVFGELN